MCEIKRILKKSRRFDLVCSTDCSHLIRDKKTGAEMYIFLHHPAREIEVHYSRGTKAPAKSLAAMLRRGGVGLRRGKDNHS